MSGVVYRQALWLALVLLLASVSHAATFSCTVRASSSCNAGEALLLRLNSSESGSAPNNSHAQLANYSGTLYPYSVCCTTDAYHTLQNGCGGNSTSVVNLWDVDNNHVSTVVTDVNNVTYSLAACLNVTPANITCEYPNNACDPGYNPVMSIASTEPGDNNLTNCHVGMPGYYARQVCCKLTNSPPTMTSARITPTIAYRSSTLYGYCNATDADNDQVQYSIQWYRNGTLNMSMSSVPRNVTQQLIQQAAWSWLGANTVNALAYDSANNLVYIGADGGRFGVYNIGTNTSTDLSAIVDGCATGANIKALAFDSSRNLVYLGGVKLFCMYSPAMGTSVNLTSTVISWMYGGAINSFAPDIGHNLIYLSTSTGSFGVYNASANASTDLTGIVPWEYGHSIYSLAYDSSHNLVYLGGYQGGFYRYNATANTGTNLKYLLPYYLSHYNLYSLAYDHVHNLVYIGSQVGNFGVYDASANTVTDLAPVLAGIGWADLMAMTFDDSRNIVYLSASGGIDAYNASSNTTVSLTGTISGCNGAILLSDTVQNRVVLGPMCLYNVSSNKTVAPIDTVSSWVTAASPLAIDPSRGMIYLGGTGDTFGSYNISSGKSTDLTSAVTSWLNQAGAVANGIAVDTSRNLVYLSGSTSLFPLFGVYNASSNTSADLSSTMSAWWGSLPLSTIALDSTHNLVYVGGAGQFTRRFGVYNASSNTSTNLTGKVSWVGNNGISALAYDTPHSLVYLTGYTGKFGFYNASSGTSTDLTGTVSGWYSTSTSPSLAYDDMRNVVYLSADNWGAGTFGFYNASSGTSTNLSNKLSGCRPNTLTLDTKNNLVYVSGANGNLCRYNASSGMVDDVSNVVAGWVRGTSIDAVVVDNTTSTVYLAAGALLGSFYQTTSYPQGVEQQLSSRTGLRLGDSWIFGCFASDGTANSLWLNSSAVLVVNAIPTTPTIVYPSAGNMNVFERYVTHDWSDSYDGDYDPVVYDFNLTASGLCSVQTYQSSLASSGYAFNSELCTDQTYTWAVRACDPYNCSAWAQATYQVPSIVGVQLVVNQVQFGTFGRGQTKATDDGVSGVSPFIVKNTGNVRINVTLVGNNSPFSTAALPTANYQFKTGVDTANAFNQTGSQLTYTPIPVAEQCLLKQLNYSTAAAGNQFIVNSTARIDMNITVPINEPSGNTQGNITIKASAS